MAEKVAAPRAILTELWHLAGGDEAALAQAKLSGADPVLPSSFRLGVAAQAVISASGLAAAELWHQRTGRRQTVAVDMRHAAAEFRSERYLRVDRDAPALLWDELAGIYRARDGFVRL